MHTIVPVPLYSPGTGAKLDDLTRGRSGRGMTALDDHGAGRQRRRTPVALEDGGSVSWQRQRRTATKDCGTGGRRHLRKTAPEEHSAGGAQRRRRTAPEDGSAAVAEEAGLKRSSSRSGAANGTLIYLVQSISQLWSGCLCPMCKCVLKTCGR